MPSGSGIKVRLMEIGDYAEIYSLWMKSENMGFNNVDDSERGIAGYLARNPSSCFVAENDGGRIAGAILAGHDGRRGFIYHLAVDPDFRRRGVGRSLVDSALRALKSDGISKVALLCFAYNDAGNAFWEKAGFSARSDVVYRNKTLLELTRIDT